MIIGLIPARFNSQRIPGKPLAKIDGLPMIIHVMKRAMLSKQLDKVIVCTDDKLVLKEVEKFGGICILTSKKHKNGTERICEVAKKIQSEIIVDIQCDEVFLEPIHLDKIINYHKKNKKYDIIIPHSSVLNYNNKHIVKIISNEKGKILYMSRADIPFFFREKKRSLKKHLDFISFKRKSLLKYCKLKKTLNEKKEGIELMRALDNNFNVGTIKIKTKAFSINTKKDLRIAKKIMRKNKLRKKY
jgi:3-deoxy-manno-octulosonate cytidylyltransferase (CMP-KDO synthetase)